MRNFPSKKYPSKIGEGMKIRQKQKRFSTVQDGQKIFTKTVTGCCYENQLVLKENNKKQKKNVLTKFTLTGSIKTSNLTMVTVNKFLYVVSHWLIGLGFSLIHVRYFIKL